MAKKTIEILSKDNSFVNKFPPGGGYEIDSDTDWDTIVESGYYNVGMNSGYGKNAPPSYGYGVLVVFTTEYKRIVQIYYPHAEYAGEYKVCIRFKWETYNKFESWHIFRGSLT